MSRQPAILVVEDDDILGASLTNRLRLENMEPVWAKTAGEAIEQIEHRRFDAVVSDIRLPDGSGEDVFWVDHSHFSLTPTIFTTAYGEIDQAVRLVKLGAVDYLTKPYDLGVLIDRLRALASHGARAEDGDKGDLPGSAAMRAVLEAAGQIAASRENLLLFGPPGVGKQRIARLVHDLSSASGAPFVVVEGAALGGSGGERLLFGAADEADPSPGLLGMVGAGTLLVTEVSDLSAEIQPRLVRLLASKLYRPAGTAEEQRFAGRIMATTSRPPLDLVTAGTLRFDLYQALAVLELQIPALCERRDDILPLADKLLDQAMPVGAQKPRLGEDATRALLAHEWPGNVRELRNRLIRAAILSKGDAITAQDLFPEVPPHADAASAKLEAARRDAEKHAIVAALAENNGRIVETARALGVSRVTLWSKMKRFGIDKA